MKSFIYIFTLFFSVALLTACLDLSDNNKDDEPYSIELVNDIVVLSADETQKPNSIEFTVSDDWYIAPETSPETEYKGSDWVTVDTEHGSKGTHSIGIIAQANFSGKEREAAFRLTCGENSSLIIVKQSTRTQNGTILDFAIPRRIIADYQTIVSSKSTDLIQKPIALYINDEKFDVTPLSRQEGIFELPACLKGAHTMYVTIGEEQYQFGEVEIYTSGEPISNFVVGFPFSMDVDNITTLVTCNSGSYDYSFASDSNGAISLPLFRNADGRALGFCSFRDLEQISSRYIYGRIVCGTNEDEMIHYDTTNYTASLWSSSSQQVIIDIATGLVYYIDEQDVLIRMNAQFQQRDERSFYVSNLQRYQEDLDFNTRIYIIELPEGDLNHWKELSQHNPGLYVTARAYKTQVPDAIGIWGKWIGTSDGSIYLNENQIMNEYGKIKEFTPPTEGQAKSEVFTCYGSGMLYRLRYLHYWEDASHIHSTLRIETPEGTSMWETDWVDPAPDNTTMIWYPYYKAYQYPDKTILLPGNIEKGNSTLFAITITPTGGVDSFEATPIDREQFSNIINHWDIQKFPYLSNHDYIITEDNKIYRRSIVPFGNEQLIYNGDGYIHNCISFQNVCSMFVRENDQLYLIDYDAQGTEKNKIPLYGEKFEAIGYRMCRFK